MTFRSWSIALFAAAVGIPAVVLIRLERYIESSYHAKGLLIEGKAVASTFLTLIPISCLLSLSGLALAVVAYRRLPKPRPTARKLELTLMAMLVPMWFVLVLPLMTWVRD